MQKKAVCQKLRTIGFKQNNEVNILGSKFHISVYTTDYWVFVLLTMCCVKCGNYKLIIIMFVQKSASITFQKAEAVIESVADPGQICVFYV